MPDEISFKPLTGVSRSDILDVFNLSFSDYSLPLQLTIEQLDYRFKTGNFHLPISVGAFRQNVLIGFILHGMRQTDEGLVAYNGGTGVVPGERSQQLTGKMYDYILPAIQKSGVRKIVLEVISDNHPALTSYYKLGFQIQRTLNCYSGSCSLKDFDSTVTYKEGINPGLYDLHQMQEIQPAWQHSNPALEATKDQNIYIGAFNDQWLVGYLIYTPSTKRIQQLGVHQDFRCRGIGSGLLHYVTITYGKELSFINLDAHYEGMHAFLTRSGLSVKLKQFEMRLMVQ